MPMTICSNCRVSVTVPNVDTTAPFMCPYCKTPNHMLYKCFSCTQISIFDSRAMPRTCPKCFTIVRSSQPLQVPFIESNWLYHVTGIPVARLVRVNGLCSSYIRTGDRKPDPNGSFWLDRVNRIDKKYREILTKYMVFYRNYKDPKPVARGKVVKKIAEDAKPLNLDEDFKDDGSLPRPKIVCPKTASNDDYQVLEKAEQDFFEAIAQKNMPGFVCNPKNYRVVGQEHKTQELVDALIAKPNHYLSLLAKEAAEHDFGVEGAITASHVYFLNTKDEKNMFSGLRDYTKLRPFGSYVILRAPRAEVVGLEEDLADFRAVRTEAVVPGNIFQIMVGTNDPATDFKNHDFRSRRENWMSLADWNG